jgi:hypothetical protein
MPTVRIQNRVQAFVTREFYRQGNKVAPDSVPDLLQPLKELISKLLPHLQWQGVDDSNPSNIAVLFKTTEMTEDEASFDIDSLSSGEKAAVALFLPIVERAVTTLVEAAEPQVDGVALPNEGFVPLTFLIDEPEIHLHPLLQLNVLAYMREVAQKDEVQFIFTTQSPALLDALEPGELFQVNPVRLSPDNQFIRLSDSREHLEAARRIMGSTHLLTRSKPIVFIEGEADVGTSVTDERLLKLLIAEAQHWAIIASHGKSQVIKAVVDMQATRLNLPGFPVFGLVDGDQGSAGGLDTILQWPVAMVENLLLDAKAIFAALKSYGGHSLTSVAKAAAALEAAADAQRGDEVRLRIEASLPKRYLRATGEDLNALEERANVVFDEYLEDLRGLDVAKLGSEAEREVKAIEDGGAKLERFRGKPLLRRFYDEQKISSLGLGWHAFLTELATEAAAQKRCHDLTRSPIARIQLYFPATVVSALEAGGDLVPQETIDAARDHRSAWEEGKPRLDGRDELRSRLIELSRVIRDAGKLDEGNAVLDAAVGIRLGD